jgi:hypothetical protein
MKNSGATSGVSQEDNQNPHRDIARWTKAVAIFTLALVIVSGFSDWFIYQQYRVANDSQIDARAQLRALVSFVGGQILVGKESGSENGIFYLFQPMFRNFGSTRTHAFKAWASVHYFQGSVPYSQDFTRPWEHVEAENSIIPPNGTVTLAPVSISSDEAIKAENHQGQIIIWGRAEWSDVYEPDRIHVIKFCQIMQPLDPNNAPRYIIVGQRPTQNINAVNFQPLAFRSDCNSSE